MRTDIDIQEMRRLLERRRWNLMWRYRADRHQSQEDSIDIYGYDEGDQAVRERDYSQLQQMTESELDELREVDAALARLEDGTYGECIDCGDDIDVDRLRALPQTQLCVECADLRERDTRRPEAPPTL